MRCTQCQKLVPEGHLIEHPKYAKVAAQVASMEDEETSFGDGELKFSPGRFLAQFEGVFHRRPVMIAAGGGRIGARTVLTVCGPVVEEVIDPYQDQLEHFLGEKF